MLWIGVMLAIICAGSLVLAIWSGDWRWLIATVVTGYIVYRS